MAFFQTTSLEQPSTWLQVCHVHLHVLHVTVRVGGRPSFRPLRAGAGTGLLAGLRFVNFLLQLSSFSLLLAKEVCPVPVQVCLSPGILCCQGSDALPLPGPFFHPALPWPCLRPLVLLQVRLPFVLGLWVRPSPFLSGPPRASASAIPCYSRLKPAACSS